MNQHPSLTIEQVIKVLLGPDGCPWDKEQTPQSLGDYVIEEAYELVEALRIGSVSEVREEIGDLFFLLFFIIELHERQGHFSLADVFEENAAKMIRRHPHVFAETQIHCRDELLMNWERIKKEEKSQSPQKGGLFSSLPKSLPPLLKAYRLHSKAARIGFTWESDDHLEKQLWNEWNEWLEAKKAKHTAKMNEEFGDFLFTLVEYARRQGIKPNAALEGTNLKFLERFQAMEQRATHEKIELSRLPLDKLNALWETAKKQVG